MVKCDSLVADELDVDNDLADSSHVVFLRNRGSFL
ncbi:MAG: hypothetical protein BWY74_03134 [Firmicutes bacterium ADurb.Bin419]|nr:MAG: hypothetical protein BWY74_03134 [Firmicutes bacterium ADurb.Bin419]